RMAWLGPHRGPHRLRHHLHHLAGIPRDDRLPRPLGGDAEGAGHGVGPARRVVLSLLPMPQRGVGRTLMTTATLTPQIVTGSARASSRAEMDAAVAALQESKGAWTAVSVRERREILGELSRRFLAVADRWYNLGIEAEGLDREHPG